MKRVVVDIDMDKVDMSDDWVYPGELRPQLQLVSYHILHPPFFPTFRTPGVYMILVTRGELRYHSADGEEGLVTKGQLLTYHRGVNRYQVRRGAMSGYHLAFLPIAGHRDAGPPATADVGPIPHLVTLGDDESRAVTQFERCMEALLRLRPAWQLEASAAIFEILQLVFERAAGPTRDADLRLDEWQRLLASLSEHDSMPQVRDLAAEMGYTTETFIRKFKELTGSSPKQYMIRSRLRAARQRLRDGSSVKAAALAVGFDDPMYFSRRYRKEFGHPPSSAMAQRSDDPDDGAELPLGLPVSHYLRAPGTELEEFYV